jgi:hypothetical protein
MAAANEPVAGGGGAAGEGVVSVGVREDVEVGWGRLRRLLMPQQK